MHVETRRGVLSARESLPGHEETRKVNNCKQIWSLRSQEPLSLPTALREYSQDSTHGKSTGKV